MDDVQWFSRDEIMEALEGPPASIVGEPARGGALSLPAPWRSRIPSFEPGRCRRARPPSAASRYGEQMKPLRNWAIVGVTALVIGALALVACGSDADQQTQQSETPTVAAQTQQQQVAGAIGCLRPAGANRATDGAASERGRLATPQLRR